MFSTENIRDAYHVEEVNSSFARIWVVDSNRPFQPNDSTNQDNSYVEFYCCGSDGRWKFRFKVDDRGSKVIDDFIFATPTTQLHGDTAALTEGDVITGLFEMFIDLLGKMGAMKEGAENTSGTNY